MFSKLFLFGSVIFGQCPGHVMQCITRELVSGCTVAGTVSIVMYFEQNADGLTRGYKYRDCLQIVERVVH